MYRNRRGGGRERRTNRQTDRQTESNRGRVCGTERHRD